MKALSRGLLVVSLLSAGVASGCHKQHPHAAERLRLEVTTAIRKDTEITHDYVCQIRAFQHIEVRALERGYLRDIFIDEGAPKPLNVLMAWPDDITVDDLAAAACLLVAVESVRRDPGRECDTRTGGSGGFNHLDKSAELVEPYSTTSMWSGTVG